MGSHLPQPGSTARSWLEPQQPRVWDHSSSGAPASLCATVPRLHVGFPSLMVTAAEVQLGRCSLRKLSCSAAFTTHIPALKESGAAGAARAPFPGCQLCVCSDNWYGPSQLDSLSIAAFLTSLDIIEALHFPWGYISVAQEGSAATVQSTAAVTSNCSIGIIAANKASKKPKGALLPQSQQCLTGQLVMVLFVTSVSLHSSCVNLFHKGIRCH